MSSRNSAVQYLAVIAMPIVMAPWLQTSAAEPDERATPATTEVWDARRLEPAITRGCYSTDCSGAVPHRVPWAAASRNWGAALVELPDSVSVGPIKRPRLGIGMRSPLLESSLQDVGIEARRCLAPVLRMNTKMSRSSALSGTVWVYARCTFN